ncbi:MAG TPA: CHASE3 domain-containing protein [Beijerinckiaceae bacterium]|nr:CHASE3 domain-containing protein [Beijerinckiaceae bacterium]
MKDFFTRRSTVRHPVLLALGFTIMAAISAASVWLVDRVEMDAKWVTHTLAVENQLRSIVQYIRRAESGQRSYLLTASPEDLETYRTGVASVEAALDGVRALIVDNPIQQQALAALEPDVRQRLDDLAETIRLFDAGDRDGAVARVRTGRGRDFAESIIAQVARMQDTERQLYETRSQDFRRTTRWLLAITLFGALLVVLLAGLSVFLVRRAARDLEAAHKALGVSYAGLEETLTERAAELRDANEEVQRFAYIVSHDLRAPLVNIMGFTSELEALRDEALARLRELRAASDGKSPDDETLAADFSEALGFIKASIAKMDRLINAILKLSREGGRTFKPEPIDTTALLKGIAASLAHQAEVTGATLEIGDLPPITSDRLALEQVFSNLLDNALKYLRPDAPGRIAVTGRAAGSRVVYEVSDNGRGIAERDRERVFELFRRAGAQDKPGEGIGLAHVRALVRRLGGTIRLASEPGQGSTFTIALPKAWAVETEKKAA